MTLVAGVVAVQGNVAEHVTAIERAAASVGEDVDVREVREAGVVPDCDLLALPGGESTTISRLLRETGIASEICAHVDDGEPLFATCAGLIVASRDARDDRVDELELVDVAVERNAFGRQRDSFEAPLEVDGLAQPFPAVFIRAPAIDDVGDAEVLATWDGRPVAARDGPVLTTAFHPELTGDPRLHRLAFFDGDETR
ncbi:pyridoxal 5'-phosphate synthase glutaminase subunit PdxT [Natrialbaceae archaeon AArc-T1-2]|uniref:pyridoxal 5'-phosphate synthase glutaminase subunit PdxT n=1 Tax=Natrialbaceae archaeon AArc-T1-2 TaxID=3053904 RepID=UPI00255AB14B|nr:pyridoxal 5'-phosphate synthase glutaminase subunit PdxT [Natrialbaceae archaeon AArc-T1-2]WIV68228.1 pyridoxal 5'-phosphate synthase glutaminase subunit PdxT [Natrialbaceae archaeon AArc-T1-2]